MEMQSDLKPDFGCNSGFCHVSYVLGLIQSTRRQHLGEQNVWLSVPVISWNLTAMYVQL